MLVRVHQGFIMIGYTKEKIRRQLICRRIEVYDSVEFICDEAEVEVLMPKKIKEHMEKSKGWGIDFEGWTSYTTEVPKEHQKYDLEGISKLVLKSEYVKDWKMDKILKKLSGVEFAQFCKEMGNGAS